MSTEEKTNTELVGEVFGEKALSELIVESFQSIVESGKASGSSHLLQTKSGYDMSLTVKRNTQKLNASASEIYAFLRGVAFALGIE